MAPRPTGGASNLLSGPSEHSQHREIRPLPAHLTGDGLPDEVSAANPVSTAKASVALAS